MTSALLPALEFEATIGAALAHRAAVDGDRDFVVSPDRSMTYAQVERASATLASRMLLRGIGKGTRVGLYFSYSPEWLVSWLAATRIGALVVPLSTVAAPRELRKALRSGDVQVLVTATSVAGKDVVARLGEALPGLAGASGPVLRLPEAPYLRSVWMGGQSVPAWACAVDLLDAAGPAAGDAALLAAAEAEVVPSDLAVNVYTSGSSGEPKGVVHTHAAILRSGVIVPPFVNDAAGDLPPKVFCAMPFFWIGGLLTIAGALLAPITLLVVEKVDPGLVLELIERERGTYIMAWPSLFERLRGHPDFATRDLTSIPVLTAGPADIAVIETADGSALIHRSMSETMGSFAAVESRIIDPETGLDVPLGTDGELLVRGPGVMEGYYKRERLEVFDADGWYHTGDRCFRLDGYPTIFYRGRYTDMIKVSGANVAPREIELVLEELAAIRHCFVVGVPEADGEESVTALVVPSADAAYVDDDVLAHARASLAAYKVPTRWIRLAEEDVPWLGSGKPDKVALRQRIEAGLLA